MGGEARAKRPAQPALHCRLVAEDNLLHRDHGHATDQPCEDPVLTGTRALQVDVDEVRALGSDGTQVLDQRPEIPLALHRPDGQRRRPLTAGADLLDDPLVDSHDGYLDRRIQL